MDCRHLKTELDENLYVRQYFPFDLQTTLIMKTDFVQFDETLIVTVQKYKSEQK